LLINYFQNWVSLVFFRNSVPPSKGFALLKWEFVKSALTPSRWLDLAALPRTAAVILVLLCLAVNLRVLRQHFHMVTEMSDGGTFYVGSKLLGTPKLYDVSANLDAQQLYAKQAPNPGLIFCRLPYVVWLWKPLAALPYLSAMIVWRVLGVLALLAAIFVFPAPRQLVAIAVAVSIPAMHALLFGQDVPFLLLFIAVSLALVRAKKDGWAGLVLSLCGSKFHFLILSPIAILIHRRFRFMTGLLLGLLIEILISFVVQGHRWPIDFWRVLTMANMNTHPGVMPDLLGLFAGTRFAVPLTILSDVIVLGLLVIICRRQKNFQLALTMSILCALLVTTHSYAHDCLVVLPALLLLSADVRYRAWAGFLILPPIYLLVGAWKPIIGPAAFVVPMLALLAVLATTPSLPIRNQIAEHVS